MDVESKEDKESRLLFRLSKGISRILLTLALATTSLLTAQTCPTGTSDKATTLTKRDCNTLAGIYADSAYLSNINGSYSKILAYADTCRYYLNLHYPQLRPKGEELMKQLGSLSIVPAEIKWCHGSLPMDYGIVLDICNKSAVAALALYEWEVYKYNNSVYTHPFKGCYADDSLGEYRRMMVRSRTNKNVAAAPLVLFLLSVFPVYYAMYYRHRLSYQFHLKRVK